MAEKLCPLMRGPAMPSSFPHFQPPAGATEPQPCIEHRCRWYIQLLGKNPQTGDPVPEWGCAVEFIPILLIENAGQVRQHAAAVESARNEARNDAATISAAVLHAAEAMHTAAARPVVSELLDVRPASLLKRLRLAFKGGA